MIMSLTIPVRGMKNGAILVEKNLLLVTSVGVIHAIARRAAAKPSIVQRVQRKSCNALFVKDGHAVAKDVIAKLEHALNVDIKGDVIS